MNINEKSKFDKGFFKGSASMLINYDQGKISIFHGTDKTLLHSWEERKEENQWKIIWELIYFLKLNSKKKRVYDALQNAYETICETNEELTDQ